MWLYLILALPVIYTLYVLSREFRNKMRLSRYKNQGFETIYNPFWGDMKLVIEGQKLKDQNQPMANLAKTYRGAPGVVINHSSGHRSWIHLLDNELVREYLMIETDVSSRTLLFDVKEALGFMMVGGVSGLHQRTVFSNIFSQKNLNKIAPLLRHIIIDLLEEANKHDAEGESLRIGKFKNSNELLEEFIQKVTTSLNYPSSVAVPTTKSGTDPAQEFSDIMGLIFSQKAGYHPLNLVFEGLPHNFNLLAGSREARERTTELMSLLKKLITDRQQRVESVGYDNFDASGINIIDEMLLHNHTARKEGKLEEVLTLDQMASNCNLFSFTSSDTIMTSCKSVYFHLAQDPQLQDQLRSEIKKSGLENGITSMDQIDDCELLTNVMMEAIRVYPPGPLSFDRMIFKDFKLGKYQFYKGDLITVSYGASMWNPEHFPAERQFKLGEFKPTNKKHFMPFSVGKRACIGRVLAELVIKQMLICTLSKFRLEARSKPEDLEYNINLAMKLDNCYVKLVPRK